MFVFAGIIYCSAVEYIASAVASSVGGDAFFIGEGTYSHFQALVFHDVVELRHRGEFSEYLVQVWIFVEWGLEQPAQVAQGERNAGQEMRLFFEIASESVCA